MAEAGKEALKGRTIRTSDETYEKFRKIAQENFENQGQCFSMLIHLYELEQGKTLIGDRKLEIENFQMHINALLNMFVHSLQMNEDAEERVKSGIQDILDTKDRTIIQLQKERNQIQQQCNQAMENQEELKSQITQLNASFSSERNAVQIKTEQLEQTIKDKNELIELLNGQKQELQRQLSASIDVEKKLRKAEADMTALQQQYAIVQNKLTLEEQLRKQENEKQQKQLALEQEKYAFDLEKELLKQKKDLQLSWEQEKMEYSRKLELYQMKYVTALERIEQTTNNNTSNNTTKE